MPELNRVGVELVVEARQQSVKLNCPGVRVVFTGGQTHRDAHKEDLRQLEAHLATVNKITVIQRLQAE